MVTKNRQQKYHCHKTSIVENYTCERNNRGYEDQNAEIPLAQNVFTEKWYQPEIVRLRYSSISSYASSWSANIFIAALTRFDRGTSSRRFFSKMSAVRVLEQRYATSILHIHFAINVPEVQAFWKYLKACVRLRVKLTFGSWKPMFPKMLNTRSNRKIRLKRQQHYPAPLQ